MSSSIDAGTLMFVTHGLAEIRRQCNRAIWIEQGVLRADGAVDDVIDEYVAYVRLNYAPDSWATAASSAAGASGPKPTSPSDTATTP